MGECELDGMGIMNTGFTEACEQCKRFNMIDSPFCYPWRNGRSIMHHIIIWTMDNNATLRNTQFLSLSQSLLHNETMKWKEWITYHLLAIWGVKAMTSDMR